uniref:Uncharacterized protein n=1 Tax=viral metagenome TaxID=1070528 RepID=A0A6M3X6J7_9ZZZZ
MKKEDAWYWFTLGAAYMGSMEYPATVSGLFKSEQNNEVTRKEFEKRWKLKEAD